MGGKEKIGVLAASFVLFLGGVFAIGMDRGPARTAVLAVSFAGLIAMALRQSLRRKRKKEK